MLSQDVQALAKCNCNQMSSGALTFDMFVIDWTCNEKLLQCQGSICTWENNEFCVPKLKADVNLCPNLLQQCSDILLFWAVILQSPNLLDACLLGAASGKEGLSRFCRSSPSCLGPQSTYILEAMSCLQEFMHSLKRNALLPISGFPPEIKGSSHILENNLMVSWCMTEVIHSLSNSCLSNCKLVGGSLISSSLREKSFFAGAGGLARRHHWASKHSHSQRTWVAWRPSDVAAEVCSPIKLPDQSVVTGQG